MGEDGMEEHQLHSAHMKGPDNTLPMMTGDGPFGPVGMGGMFTLVKIRDVLREGQDPGWYENPEGTVATKVLDVKPAPAQKGKQK